MSNTPKITATIITYNEEKNIARALESLRFVDEVIIVDSQSTDDTVLIAKSFGAQVIQNPFKNYGNQKNFAADHASHEWVLNIDADEVVTPKLRENIQKAIQDTKISVYALDRLNFYAEKPIYHGGWYPDYQNRLYQKSIARWSEPKVHEWLSASKGKTQKLEGKLNHYSFMSEEDQVRRNQKYSQQGAKELLENNKTIKAYSALIRSAWKFIHLYFIRLGILDGYIGFIIAKNSARAVSDKYKIAFNQKTS